jgi:hypothetical protein
MTEDIQIPDTTPKVRRRNAGPTADPADANVDAVQQTLAEYERAAIGTGEWKGTDAPEFSEDGETWSTAWLPKGQLDPNLDVWIGFPALARATVHRKGVRPVVVVIRWNEALPAVEPWRTLWEMKPTTLFGAFALRAAYRRAFRDVIGDHHAPDEHHEEVTA